MKYKFSLEKLVRDKVAVGMRNAGILASGCKLDAHEYAVELRKKLIEEASEVKVARNREGLVAELADVLEVLRAICKHEEVSMDAVEAQLQSARESKGGFEQKEYVKIVELDCNDPWFKYFLCRYPQITD
jgi:predicted house-cleaning noncanonical NTP pyrophosphatase (MazG superfamily)